MAGKKMQRRSAFESWTDQAGGTPSQATPPTPIDLMGVEPKKRNRGWEKEHRTHSYRGVPPEVHKQVTALASQLDVNIDEVVQVFVRYSLSCLNRNILTLSPRPKAQRMTLFPLPNGWGDQVGWSEAGGWNPGKLQEIPGKKKVSQKAPSLWEMRAHYRLPADVHEAIRQIALKHTLPVGEIMTLFLKYGLEAYKAGHLVLTPHPKVVRMTLSEVSS